MVNPPPWTPGPAQSGLRTTQAATRRLRWRPSPVPTRGLLVPAGWSPALPRPPRAPQASPTFRRSWRAQSWPSGRGARQRCCTGSDCPAEVVQRLRRASETLAPSASASTSQGFQQRCSESLLHTDPPLSAHSEAGPASAPRASGDAAHGRGTPGTAQWPDTPVWPGPGWGSLMGVNKTQTPRPHPSGLQTQCGRRSNAAASRELLVKPWARPTGAQAEDRRR